MGKYNFKKIEAKWNKKWTKDKTYEPKLKAASAPPTGGRRKPFYNLMMFPYPSAEGLHIGGARTFTGVDIYGRLKRMQGHDVLEPIGLDGFGINSENFALKIGKHPTKHAKDSEKNFYRQLHMLGNGFSWDEKLETYDPEYYRWTQWIFVQMFKHGLAYRKKQAVNWCPTDKTVLSDEQAEGGVCERCGSKVEKRELEQWFFKITDYADRLLKNLPSLDWTEKIKIAQRNWIGKSEGALVSFPLQVKTEYVFLHGFKASPEHNFWPWLKEKLEKAGWKVQAPRLPRSNELEIEEKVMHVLSKVSFSKDTVLVAHSLGCVVALQVLSKLKIKIKKLVLVAPPLLENKKNNIIDRNILWGKLNLREVVKKVEQITVLADFDDPLVPFQEQERMAVLLGARFIPQKASSKHFMGKIVPEIWNEVAPEISVFTTRVDTIFGATYIVVAPENALVAEYQSSIKNYAEVSAYIKKSLKKKDEERLEEGKNKTGVELKGLKVKNPATGESVPIWVADYVLGSYGTGAIMAVPAHDKRDFDFAEKFHLPIKPVIESPHNTSGPYNNYGTLINSGQFNGLDSEEAKEKMIQFLGAKKEVRFRLRDWLISRQRYWGPPIPMIYCEACAESGQGERLDMPGWYTVPEKQLPVVLPYVKDFRPRGTGVSPLASKPGFYKVKCPKCGSQARRETDVSDTFLDSAWYFLRYPSTRSKKAAWDPKTTQHWLPVNMYIGGAEHAVLHLLYSRFLIMVFSDQKLLNFQEPFTVFRAHGLITKDGAKMSKSKGNVVNPDEYFEKFGADVMRLYLAFLAPFEQGGDFRDNGILGITRFLERVSRKDETVRKEKLKKSSQTTVRSIHRAVKKVTEDIELLRYNTAISALMIVLNEIEEQEVSKEDWKIFLKLLAPFAPYITEELWSEMGERRSIHRSAWPVYNEAYLHEKTVTIVIQINGKVRDSIEIDRDRPQKEIEQSVLEREKIKGYLEGKHPKKMIYIPNRLLNIVM